MVGPAPEQKTKKRKSSELDEQFEQFMKKPLSQPRVVEEELKKYEGLALAKAPKPAVSWRDFLKQVLESPLPKDGEVSLDSYVKAAMASQTPVPVRKAEPESVRAMRDMVAKKTPSEAKLTEGAVSATLELALMLEAQDVRKANFRKWCGEEKVV
jgi:hypothetical protein